MPISNSGRSTGGGSQPFRVETASIDWTEFTHEDDEKTLFTPAAGEWLIKAWGDVENAVAFNDTGSIDISVNEDPPGPDFTFPGTYFWGFDASGIGANAQGGPGDTDNEANHSVFAGIDALTGTRLFAGGPVKARAQSVNGDGTAGHLEMFFLIWTP